MRKLAFLLLAFALPLFADTFQNVVIRDSNRSFSDGDADDLAGLGRRYASFERDGVRYVIRDEATLARLLKELQPQVDLGHEQAEIGGQQAKLGQKQAELGQQQAAIGAQQAAHWNDRELAGELQEKQRRLQRRQEELADQQRPLAEQQRVLAEKQREASRRAKVRMAAIFEEALRNGVAKRR
jgi:ribosomal protein L44E